MTSVIGDVRYLCIMKHSLSKFDCHFNDVDSGPLVFEIWIPAAGFLATLLSRLVIAVIKPSL